MVGVLACVLLQHLRKRSQTRATLFQQERVASKCARAKDSLELPVDGVWDGAELVHPLIRGCKLMELVVGLVGGHKRQLVGQVLQENLEVRRRVCGAHSSSRQLWSQ